MKRLRRFKPVLLMTAAAIAGCGAPPVIEPSQAIAPTVKAMSCTERSASARPPKNPIVELAWCIAETDDLYDPDHLFHETLRIKNYRTSKSGNSAIQASAGGRFHPEETQLLPVGIDSVRFVRTDTSDPEMPDWRHVLLSIDPHKSCIRTDDIFLTFGQNYRLSPVPIRVPASAMPNTPTHETPKVNPYGISYQSTRLFGGHPRGFVSFRFDYGECVLNINVQRDMQFITHQQQEKRP